jgi:hypothetical protein
MQCDKLFGDSIQCLIRRETQACPFTIVEQRVLYTRFPTFYPVEMTNRRGW